jgi:hypothetical protein
LRIVNDSFEFCPFVLVAKLFLCFHLYPPVLQPVDRAVDLPRRSLSLLFCCWLLLIDHKSVTTHVPVKVKGRFEDTGPQLQGTKGVSFYRLSHIFDQTACHPPESDYEPHPGDIKVAGETWVPAKKHSQTAQHDPGSAHRDLFLAPPTLVSPPGKASASRSSPTIRVTAPPPHVLLSMRTNAVLVIPPRTKLL